MPKTLDLQKDTARKDSVQVPTKEEFLAVLQSDTSRGGMQLEWMLDRCTDREERL